MNRRITSLLGVSALALISAVGFDARAQQNNTCNGNYFCYSWTNQDGSGPGAITGAGAVGVEGVANTSTGIGVRGWGSQGPGVQGAALSRCDVILTRGPGVERWKHEWCPETVCACV